MNLESEELNMEKIPEWIYAPTNFSPELEKTFEAVEKALGFKLFIWQKTFIANTTYRRSGRTTAEILRALLNVSKPPLDYTKPVVDHMERFYREETREIKAKLDAAGIPTRTVFFSWQEKQKYYSEAEAGSAALRRLNVNAWTGSRTNGQGTGQAAKKCPTMPVTWHWEIV